ncbi:MAG TPA: amidase [Stellaceae bacterium]|jgi:aspartyl-tRNA(Asn)/glutamyl-tRNA(Gln) amidotransferase subunit A|nr:amidase [Stellaceae bacterium]
MPSAAVPQKPTVLGLAEALAAGQTSSRALTEAALARIADPAGEGARSFVKVYADSARAAADAQDRLRRAGYVASPLAGLPVSIKDLFDVAGETTLAGSKALDDRPPAACDAPVVARLRAAGAIIIGRTNMTEFAFSGVGINPHYGTPGNPHDRRLIPGGSSSGAAVSVGDGCAIVAIGTDTGGSVRIPAALCGIVGFKPTQPRVPRDGVIPLSTTLDSIGPLANSVACCAIADAVMAGEPADVVSAPAPMPVAGLRFGVAQCYLLDGLAPEVANAFSAACTALSRAGARVVDLPLAEFDEIPAINAAGGFAPIDAYAWHQPLLARRGADYDPRVSGRIKRAAGMTAVDYTNLCAARADLIARVAPRTTDFDALLMPTVAITAPPIAAFERDEDYRHLNALILRNPSAINFLDRCAVTLPIQPPGAAPVGLMVIGEHGADRRLLGIARGIEEALAARN